MPIPQGIATSIVTRRTDSIETLIFSLFFTAHAAESVGIALIHNVIVRDGIRFLKSRESEYEP